MNGKTGAAAAGAAAVLGLPAITAGIGSAEGETPPKAPEPAKRFARAPSYTDLEGRLRVANRRVRFWRAKAKANWRRVEALRAALRQGIDPVRAGFLCIHRYEGAWNDHGAPYWGGLQMDRAFMGTYGAALVGRLGTADRWPTGAQLAVAEVAYYAGRGYGPWPNTRRACGL